MYNIDDGIQPKVTQIFVQCTGYGPPPKSDGVQWVPLAEEQNAAIVPRWKPPALVHSSRGGGRRQNPRSEGWPCSLPGANKYPVGAIGNHWHSCEGKPHCDPMASSGYRWAGIFAPVINGGDTPAGTAPRVLLGESAADGLRGEKSRMIIYSKIYEGFYTLENNVSPETCVAQDINILSIVATPLIAAEVAARMLNTQPVVNAVNEIWVFENKCRAPLYRRLLVQSFRIRHNGVFIPNFAGNFAGGIGPEKRSQNLKIRISCEEFLESPWLHRKASHQVTRNVLCVPAVVSLFRAIYIQLSPILLTSRKYIIHRQFLARGDRRARVY
ncbi:hypothetical protein B0H11DRAFT_1914746 [Mycena galericulata]|nr:hypothetical protein B0H11DRAFT_1914746 [Mycena galericulata]